MSIRCMALALTVAFITCAPVARPIPFPPATSAFTAASDSYGRRDKPHTHFTPKPYDRYYGVDRRIQPKKPQAHFIPKPYDRYYGIDRRVPSTPKPPSVASSGDMSPWPPFTVAAALLLTIA